jgi:hypothetical protein
MSEHENSKRPVIENLDPRKMQDTTESGELERPQVRRKIDCGANSEVDQRKAQRRGAPATKNRQAR